MSVSSTIAWLFDSDSLRKTIGGWAIPTAALAVAIFATSQVIKSSANSSTHEERPPMVSTWVPWLGSANSLDADPDTFIRNAMKKYPGGIFGVNIAGRIYYYVTDIKLINQIYKQPKVYTMSSLDIYWAQQVFGISPEAFAEPQTFMDLSVNLHKHIAPVNLGPYNTIFAARLHNLIFKSAPKQIEPFAPGSSFTTPLCDFITRIAFITTGQTIYGDAFDVSEIARKDFDQFDRMVYKVAGGYPNYLLPSFMKGRKKFMARMAEWYHKPHKAGPMIAGAEEILEDSPWSEKDREVYMGASLWAPLANVPFSSYWVIALSLQHPDGVQPIIDELDAAGAQFMTEHPELEGVYLDHLEPFYKSNPVIPLLQSTITEALRYASDTYSMRDVLAEECVHGEYSLQQGDHIVCVTRGVHMDTNEFGENAKEFVPRRFMKTGPIGDDTTKPQTTESQYNWMPFGGGISMCSGRYFAQFHMKCMVATMLKTFKFEVDGEKSNLKLGRLNRGFGMRRPEGDLIVKLTRL